MQKIIISLICCLLPTFAFADTVKIHDNAPDSHIVVKGDTLWDISAKFFEDPWKWPQIWGLNKDTIKDPHWIYPGDVVHLDHASGTLHVGKIKKIEETAEAGKSDSVKLSPRVHVQSSEHNAIPSISASAIEPFLSRPLIIEKNGLSNAPTIVGTQEKRVLLATGDIAYAKGLSKDQGLLWQIYRPGKTLLDPENAEVLGYEAVYLGDAEVEKFADISTLKIVKALKEINKGDRLIQASGEFAGSYVPRVPGSQIAARVISIYAGVSQAGQHSIVTLNKGLRDGLENGHVLALYRKGDVVKEKGETLTLPDVRYGLLFVFRTFDKVAYALVMRTRLPVQLLDNALTP
ncbi:MAG: LysM peptidoglycan-binding domain-containing protein [Candidatus Nitrotoga sp.]|nr:LysM peptidoglycan-binding domain-containing protein [Candidatus Nitrotoga sp.]